MAKTLRKTLVYGLLLAAGVTLGMQLAESGTTSVYGPGFQTGGTTVGANGQSVGVPYPQQQYSNGWSSGAATPAWTTTGQGYAAPQGTTGGYTMAPGYGSAQPGATTPSTVTNGFNNPATGGQVMQTPADLLMPPPSPPAVDRFADKAAHLLQQASQKSIHWVASLFGPGE
ncbi:hypothetical protein GNP92_05880 [Paenibacillus timonensis]|uniref:hypothetical protein n=1 Tax=Paenibacillus sp. J53TS2 TaxID=2807197 RepID=UPI0012D8EA18|nr:MULTISPECIES: hypothetical protein [Paenibacillus]MUG85884.1 hypothetical protein [Paenibacillus timonensis]GIP48253.1 hypothetical protein J53TS2_18440 [Paenibacillus sp. J53TS2]